jgi:hypothetical protein
VLFRSFDAVVLDLVAKLDAVESAPGVTLLDETLVQWSQECGMETHLSVSTPLVTFGSAAGFLRTGQYIDYRKTTSPASRVDRVTDHPQYLGLLHQQWLATVLQAMRVPPSEFERWGGHGYGSLYVRNPTRVPFTQHYGDTSSPYFQRASEVLPFLRA